MIRFCQLIYQPLRVILASTCQHRKLKNTGVEVLIDGTPVKTSKFSWNVSVNGSYNTSKVLALNPGQTRQVVVFFNGTGNEFLGSLVYDVGKEMNQLIHYTYLRNDKGQIMLSSSGKPLAFSKSW